MCAGAGRVARADRASPGFHLRLVWQAHPGGYTRGMTDAWEYDVVDVTGQDRHPTGALGRLVHDKEQHGWALLTVVTDAQAYGGRTWAYFKRPARQLAAA